MSDETTSWKGKYLQTLEQLEQLEALWATRVDLMRRSLVRASMAAEGRDQGVDGCLEELRELLRQGALDSALAELVPRLEKAVLTAERRRQDRAGQMAQSLHRLVEQLRQRALQGHERRALKALDKRIDNGVTQSAELQLLLHELSELQGRALSQSEDADPARSSFLQRLFGTRNLLAEGEAAPDLEVSPAPGAPAVQPDFPLARAPTPVNLSQPAAVFLDTLPFPVAWLATPLREDLASAVPPSLVAEPPYSQVAERIQATLSGMLEDLRLPEQYQAQAEALRERIQARLNWYELIPVLDDLAVLFRALNALGQQDFQNYLRQLNERLSTMQHSLSDLDDGHAKGREMGASLDVELRQQMGGLQASVSQATSLAALQEVAEARLDGLLTTIDSYQRQRLEHEQLLGSRLRQMSERLSSMERTTQVLQGNLDEQRRKALLDSLTGLPNRAAWNERLDIELVRWQRYGGDLLLAVLDVDHFKRINDSFGHMAGDRVLKIIASTWQQRLRKSDFLARFGGEEFVLLMPSTPLEAGCQLLEALRGAIEECPFHFKGERLRITVSVGLTAFAGADDAETAFERADQALYRAKHGGRNRIEDG
ncbi:GGDEF domain-containing protein [Stutzerimonas tarimensis]|uniref:diguanylate cyclase n=1 Tax=Stutzerimonas tarimensis TaxID=1507735 RepID=A0ABV7T6Y5_9GAMM